MEERKRTLLAIVISCIILLAVGYSFGLNIFAAPVQIVVADPDAVPSVPVEPAASGGQEGIPVEITSRTVQSVIAAMSRLRSYSRSIEVCYTWEGGSGVFSAKVMVDNGWSRCDVALPGGVVEHSISGDGTLWYWYGDGPEYLTAESDEHTADLVQRVPTYEDVLALEESAITGAGYEEKNGLPAIYVEAVGALPGYVERYWISVDSGLLVASETVKDDEVVYAMSASDMVSPLTGAEGAFTLPDNTVLNKP